jgi:tRNA acetyltransferase TAN1
LDRISDNMFNYNILIKTELGFERIVASRIKELDEDAEVYPSPLGFKGLVLVKSGRLDRDKLVGEILRNIVEANKVFPIDLVVKADPKIICERIKDLVIERISSDESFAIRTVRRGRHSFTSIDVNVIVGDCVRKYTGASVNLKYPDKIVFVEIINGVAYISIQPGSIEYHKYSPEKRELNKLLRRIAIIQMPYLGPPDSIKAMGRRIGREVQNFEVRELVISPIGIVDAYQLALFIESVLEGINSRYEIQRRSYHRKTYKVPVYVMDLHQLVRDRSNEVLIVFEPEGKYIVDVKDDLVKLVLHSNKRVNLLFGSRIGIPQGIYRFADLVIDVAPGITLSTDYAAAAGLIALITTIYDMYRLMSDEGSNISGG